MKPVPDAHFVSISADRSSDILSLAGRRTAALLSCDLRVVQRILDESPDEDLRCSEFFTMHGETCLALGGEHGVVKLLNVSAGTCMQAIRAHGGPVTALRNCDNRRILSCSEDATIRMWSVEDARCICVFGGFLGHRDHVLSIDVSANRRYLASSGSDCSVKVWRIPDTNTQCVQIPLFSSARIHRSPVSCVRFYGQLLVSSSDCKISVVLARHGAAEPADEMVFVGEVVLNAHVQRFLMHRDQLLALTNAGELAAFNMRDIAHSSQPAVLRSCRGARDLAVSRNTVFILLEDSSVARHSLGPEC